MRAAGTPAPARRRVLLWMFCIIYIVEQVALFALYWSDGNKTLAGDEVSYLAWANGLAGSGPMPAPTGWWPPLQAWTLAALIRLFGPNLLPLQLLQSVLMLGCGLLLRDLWRRCDGRVRAANAAAALFLLNPSTLAYAHWLWPEVPHLFCLLLALWLIVAAPWRRLAGLYAGLALGGALLAKSLLSGFWPLFGVLLWQPARRRLDRRGAILLLAGVAVVTAVPLWQGWRDSGRPMIADSSAFNLVGGLKDRWRSDYVGDSVGQLAGEYFATAPTPAARNAVFMQRAAAMLREQGLVATVLAQLQRQYFRLFNAKTLLLSQLPGEACAGYIGAYPAPHPAALGAIKLLSWSWHALTLVAFAFGVALWRRWREPLVIWTALFFAYQLALYLLLHVKARFLLPMMPFLCAFGGSFLASLSRRDGVSAAYLAASPGRWLGAGVLAAGLLALAFLGPLLDRSCGG